MLNAIPDSRPGHEAIGSFLTPNDVIGGDHEDEMEEQEKGVTHEAIDLGERRKSSDYSGKSLSSSSVEVPPRNPTVDAGKRIFLIFTQ